MNAGIPEDAVRRDAVNDDALGDDVARGYGGACDSESRSRRRGTGLRFGRGSAAEPADEYAHDEGK
jgi:hypothetical protein